MKLFLWCWAEKDDGGFAMNTVQIGNLIGISTVGMLTIGVIANNSLRKRVEVVKLMRGCIVVTTILGLAFPALTLLRYTEWAKYIGIGSMSCLWWATNFLGYSSVVTLQNKCVANSERGKINGLGIMANSAGKALAPLGLGSLFASTAKSGLPYPLNFGSVFCVMCLVYIVMFGIAKQDFLNNIENKQEGIPYTKLQEVPMKDD